jgi:hypothetical protein
VSERFEKLVFNVFLEDRMGIKNLMLHDDLTSLTDGKEQNKTEFKTTFCEICFLPNEFLPITGDANDSRITPPRNFVDKMILSPFKKICWEVLDNSIILLRERERERERERDRTWRNFTRVS